MNPATRSLDKTGSGHYLPCTNNPAWPQITTNKQHKCGMKCNWVSQTPRPLRGHTAIRQKVLFRTPQWTQDLGLDIDREVNLRGKAELRNAR